MLFSEKEKMFGHLLSVTDYYGNEKACNGDWREEYIGQPGLIQIINIPPNEYDDALDEMVLFYYENKYLHTSAVVSYERTEDLLKVNTLNSIYSFDLNDELSDEMKKFLVAMRMVK